MIDINKVADYFILCPDHEAGDSITHLKLQKMVYYAQAWHLAIYGEPLFEDDLEAWAHGPVSPKLYDRFEGYCFSREIPVKAARSRVDDEAVRSHLVEVWEIYGDFTPTALERLANSEEPWIEARGDTNPLERASAPISHATMQRYYGEQLAHGEE